MFENGLYEFLIGAINLTAGAIKKARPDVSEEVDSLVNAFLYQKEEEQVEETQESLMEKAGYKKDKNGLWRDSKGHFVKVIDK